MQPVIADFCDPVCMRNDIHEIVISKLLFVQNGRRTTIKDGGGSGNVLELSNGQVQGLTIGKVFLYRLDCTGNCENKEDTLVFSIHRIQQCWDNRDS